MIQPKVKCYVFCVLSALNFVTHALDSDKDKMMQVTSDSATFDQLHHRGVYTGHVEFVQGKTNIRADHALLKGNLHNHLTVAIAHGNSKERAHYWIEKDDHNPPLHAYANVIRYYPLRHLIVLKGNASVSQGENSLSAELITYDTIKQHVVSKNDKKIRTTLIFYPEKKIS